MSDIDKEATMPDNSVSSQISAAPEDALRGETGRALNPTIGVGLSGDQICAIKPNVRPVSRTNLCIFRPSGLLRNTPKRNGAFTPPRSANIVNDYRIVGPRPSPNGFSLNNYLAVSTKLPSPKLIIGG